MTGKYKFGCHQCGQPSSADRKWAKYCGDDCRNRARLGRRRIVVCARPCGQCGTMFTPAGPKNRNIKIFCSDACREDNRREYAKRWGKNNPARRDSYYRKSAAKFGVDRPLKRLWRTFPEMPRCCESCGDDRVLDIAHKPHARRNGARRSRKNTNPATAWILCPTCHALLDRKGWSPTELGIVRP